MANVGIYKIGMARFKNIPKTKAEVVQVESLKWSAELLNFQKKKKKNIIAKIFRKFNIKLEKLKL